MKARQRLFSILLSVCMLITALPFVAVAEGESSVVTVNGYYENGTWVQGGDGTLTHTINGTEVVLEKKAVPVEGQVNTYDITLQVQTSTTTTTSTGSGAVVLVVDTSSSMKSCAECGGRDYHERACDMSGSVTENQNRMTAAKAAAREFLATYAGKDEKASRMLSIVTFDGTGDERLDWVNVAGGAGKNSYDTALSTINGLQRHTGTNMDDGLYEAKLLLAADAVKSISSKSVVMLSDGAPSTSGHNGGGSPGFGNNKTHCDEAAEEAEDIKETGATLYTVCFGAADDDAYGNVTVGSFLANSIATSGKSYNADSTTALLDAFKAISEEISSGLTGEGWTATDPLPSNINISGALPAGFTGENGNYTWSLSDPEITTSGNTTTYTYTATYRITLDVQSINFAENKNYPTNGPTYLNVDGEQYAFPVPGVQGELPRTDVSVTKVWADDSNRDAIRTDSVTIQLQDTFSRGGKTTTENYGEPVVLSAANNWTHTWTGMIEKSENVEHQFSAVEIDVPEGYEFSPGPSGFDLTVTNTHKIETVNVDVEKVWDDANNQDGKRPASIEVTLYADGEATDKKLTLNANGQWKGSFENLPMNKNVDGKAVEIVYTVDETNVPEGYTKTVEGEIITNSYTPETVSVPVEKVWEDADDQDGIRPDAVTVELLADGESTNKTLSLSETNGWKASFTDLDKYKAGQEIAYTLKEVAVTDGYASVITGNAKDGFTVTNTHTPEVTDITVTKEWVDEDDQDGKRAASVTVQLLANGTQVGETTLNASNEWIYTFEGLPVYEAGTAIEYSVTESAVEGYTASVVAVEPNYFTVTNTHVPELITIEVTKIWDDKDNQDGIRPETITVKLMNGETEVATAVVSAEDGWKHTFENLPKYEAGQEIEYSVEEVDSGDYTASVNGFEITNSYTPAVVNIPVTKIWDDADNQDGLRAESVTVELLANGEVVDSVVLNDENNWTFTFANKDKMAAGQVITYTVAEAKTEGYEEPVIEGSVEDGFTVTNTHEPEVTEVSVTKVWEDEENQDGIRPETINVVLVKNGTAGNETLTLSDENGWKASFTNLPKYENEGQEIVYTVKEVEISGYESAITGSAANGFTVTNTHEPEKTEVSVTKIWEDEDNQDGIRPETVEIVLKVNGEKTEDTILLSEENEWTGSFTDLDKYSDGELIDYSVAEAEVPEGYESTVNNVLAVPEAEGDEVVMPDFVYEVINSYTPATTSVTVAKTWEDEDNQDGIRTESVTVELLADGEAIESVELSDENEWTYTFEELPVNKVGAVGQVVEYTVEEKAVEGYETVIGMNEDGIVTVTNTHVPEVINIDIEKVWDDKDNQDGIRPETITVKLMNGETVVETVDVTAENGWKHTFEKLPKYENEGQEIKYSIVEVDSGEYTATIDGFKITNKYTPAVVNIPVNKVWDDADNQDGLRPESVTVELLANGEKIDSVVLNEENNWTFTFANKDKMAAGKEIVYTVTEAKAEGYEEPVIEGTVEDGFSVTNTHTPELINVAVTKVWADSDDADGLRPDSVIIKLYANGDYTGKQLTLTAGGSWKGAFTGLDKYEDGEEIEYTIGEMTVEGYNSVIKGDVAKGFTVTNSHTYIPPTGDTRNQALWLGMLIFSILAMAATGFTYLKKGFVK